MNSLLSLSCMVRSNQVGSLWRTKATMLVLALIFSLPTFAQTKVWEKKYQSGLSITIKAPDGGYLLGGSSPAGKGGDKSEASRGGNDFWIVKIDNQGNKQWDKTYGGNQEDELLAMIATPDGGYLLGGTSDSEKSGEKSEAPRNFYKDFWAVKIDAQGNKLWDRTLGGDNDDAITQLAVAPDGGYLLAGNSSSNKSGDKSEDIKDTVPDAFIAQDFWVVKVNESGAKVWEKAYSGNSRDVLTSVVVSPDGGYLLGGYGGGGRGECNGKDCLGFWIVKISLTGQQQWQKNVGTGYRDYLTALLVTAEGGYLLGGNTNQGQHQAIQDILVVKVDLVGNQIWTKTYDDQGGVEGLFAMVAASNGGYLLGGYSGARTRGSWLVKIKEDGEKIGDSSVEEFYGIQNLIALPHDNYLVAEGIYEFKIAQIQWQPQSPVINWEVPDGGNKQDNLTTTIKTSDGGYLAGGYTNSLAGDQIQASQGGNDYWIVKTDLNGQRLWSQRYGGAGDDFLNRVIQTRDGGYLLAGSSFSGKGGDKTQASKGGRDYWIIKTDKQGNKQWDQVYGGNGYDELKKAVQLTTGEYVLGGYSNSPASGDKSQGSQGNTDYWLIKISSTGTKIWDKRYGGSAAEELGSFTQTKDGSFLLGGTSFSGKSGDKSQASQGDSDYWVVKTDQAGSLLWEKTFGGNKAEKAYSVGLSQGENVFIAGSSSSNKTGDKSQNTKGLSDYWLIVLDKNGGKLWDKTFGGDQDDELRASTYTTAGHYVLAGSSYSGKKGDKSQEGQGGSDYWIVEVDQNGSKVNDQRFGGSGTDELRTVTQTQDGGLLLGGRSNSSKSGDKLSGGWGNTDYWLVKTYPATNSIVAARTSTAAAEQAGPTTDFFPVMAYPNPFQDRVTIRFILPETQPATVRMLDSQGREVTTLFQGEAKANQKYEVDWQAGKQTNGMYLLQLQTPTGQNTQKLLLTK